MKKINIKTAAVFLIVIICSAKTIAQNIGVNSSGVAPNASAVLDLNTGNNFTSPNAKGFLPPNVALTGLTDIITVASPATSLLVYNTATAGISPNNVVPGYYYFNGTQWVSFSSSGNNNWALLGNAGTVPGTNFVGTTDAKDLVIKTNNTENMRVVNSTGNVGVGTPTPRGKFDVLNGDAYVADNVYTQNSNVGRSFNSIYTDNIRSFTDNGFRVYDGNSNSHLRMEATSQCQIQAYTTTGALPNLLETAGTEGILSLNPTGGGVRVGVPSGLSTTINPPVADNQHHRLTVGSGYFLAGNYNSAAIGGGLAPGTTWMGGVGGLAIGMNRNIGKSHVDLWNTTDVSQPAANANIDRGFEFRGYDNTYAQRVMARIDGIGQFFSNGVFAISDKRFKSNIVPFNEKVLSKLMQVKTYNYQMHQPVSKNGGALEKGLVVNEKDFGVIVQELYELFPGVVYKPENESVETWSVDYSRFGLYLLQGMKEQQEIINEQKTEIKQLNDKYAELLNRILKLESK